MKTLVRTSSKVNAEFIGLDVHREMTVFSVLNCRGENAAAGEFPTCRKDLSDFLDRTIGRKLSHVVFEASGSTEWIYDEIETTETETTESGRTFSTDAFGKSRAG